MTSQQARAIRRALLVGSGGLVTVVAHGAAMGHPPIGPGSLAAIATFAALAGITAAWRPRASYRPRGLVALVVALLAVQAGAHVAMVIAPWAFGLPAHDAPLALGPDAIVPHALAAVVLALVCLGAERLLGAALDLVAALGSLVEPTSAARTGPRARHTGLRVVRSSWSAIVRPAAPRGPPIWRSA